MHCLKPLAVALAAAFSTHALAAGNTLVGWARMAPDTFADGPTSGQMTRGNAYGTYLPPYEHRQPVQGFSAVLLGVDGSYLYMSDNGFGGQGNSADALLRVYSVKPDFRTADGGTGTISASSLGNGLPLERFTEPARFTLNDVNGKLTIPLQAEQPYYYGSAAFPPVDPSIRFGRLLTGADLDIESFREDRNCALWFGDEFGPFLIKTDRNGTVLRSEIPLPGVYAPQHPDVVAGRVQANLGGSGGFEGMAITPHGDRLFTLLEKPVAGDPADRLRINEFDIEAERYTGRTYFYPLQAAGHAIGDMTAVDDYRFLVIERNGATATSGVPFKKIYLIDTRRVGNGGVVQKTELVDLMNLDDPSDLNGDGDTRFTFPYVTIESVLPLDPWTLLVANDNNFPGGGGRELAADATELLKIRLKQPLAGLRMDHPAEQDHRRKRCERPSSERKAG